MSDEAPARKGPGVILVIVAVGGSAVAVGGWYLFSNRSAASVDNSGFDFAVAPETRRPVVETPAAESGAAPGSMPASSLGMLQADDGIRVAGSGGSSAAPKPVEDPKEKAAMSMKEAVLKYESKANEYGRRMEAKYPSLTQYAKDWNSYPDLKSLGQQWRRDKDPVKFLYGVVKSDNFGKIVKKYAHDPGVHAFVTNGVKEAPSDLIGAAGGVFQNDHLVKDLVGTVMTSMGLPASLTAMLGGGEVKPPDEKQILKEVMSGAGVQEALKKQQGAVALPQQQNGR